MDPGGDGPLGRNKQGAGPVGIEGKKIAASVDRLVAVIVAGGEDHLQFDPLHEARAVRAHDRIPLQEGADKNITEPGAVGLRKAEGVGYTVVQVRIDHWYDEVHTPLAATE